MTDPVKGLVALKQILTRAHVEFGQEGDRIVALALKAQQGVPGTTLAEAYEVAADAARLAGITGSSITEAAEVIAQE